MKALTKRVLAAVLFIASGLLKKASEWSMRTSMRLVGFAPPPPPIPADARAMAGGCLDCGSLFAVKAEYEAHRCPRK